MRIIHFGHACVLLETGSARLLIDPGTFSHGFETVRELDAILVTHQHADHLDLDRLPELMADNPNAALVIDPGSADDVAGVGLTARVVEPGDAFEVAGAAVNVVGGTHAVTHLDYPPVPNNGYVVDHGAWYHPGDSLFVPEQRIDVLAVPTAAPWLQTGLAVDFLRAVGPRVAVPVHEGLLAHPNVYYGWLDRLAPEGSTVTVVPRGELTEV